jgi:hypothetical protein
MAATAAVAALEADARRALPDANLGDIEACADGLASVRARQVDAAANVDFASKLHQRAKAAGFYRLVLRQVMDPSLQIADVIIGVGTPTPCASAEQWLRLQSVLTKALEQHMIAHAKALQKHAWPATRGSLVDAPKSRTTRILGA